MKRIDNRTVELTQMEQQAKDYWDEQIDNGFDIPDATRRTYRRWTWLGEDFYKWLGR